MPGYLNQIQGSNQRENQQQQLLQLQQPAPPMQQQQEANGLVYQKPPGFYGPQGTSGDSGKGNSEFYYFLIDNPNKPKS